MSRRILIPVVVCCTTLRTLAVPPAHDELDPGLDPTVLHSRVKVQNEFIEQAFDGSKNTTKLLLSYAFGNPTPRDWTLQLGRGFGARGEWVLNARYEMPLTTSEDDHTFTVGAAYVFP